jgi:hypothetical protein
MKPSRSLSTVILLAAVGALGVVAWREYRELTQLRAQLAADDSAQLRKRVAELEKRDRDLADRLAVRGQQFAGDDQGGRPEQAGGPGGRRFGRFGAFQAVLNNPQFQKLQAIQAKAQLDGRYSALFKNLLQNFDLTPAQLDQFKNLLVQRQQAAQDAAMAAMQQGLNPRADPQAFRQAVTDAEASVDQQIQSELGSQAYSAYQQYQQTLPERNTADQVAQALSYSSTPLSDDQTNQLVQILQQAAPQNANGNRAEMAGIFGFGPGANQGVPITTQAVTLAAGVLSAPQIQALQQVQQQQQAQRQMMQLMRAARQPGGGG